jgi:two-component system NtrC family sensor kinase
MFRKDSRSGLYRKVRLPYAFYREVVHRARLTLFVVLGVIYVLAILLLELDIMPVYVYRPLRLMLDADRATQAGDRQQELIDETLIPGDEIGQIMRSRNTTVTELRKHEDDLELALRRLEEVADDLKRKNRMLETAKQTLEEQDRLASLGLLSASVAHELNTPLSVLHGSIEKLIETVKDKPAQERLARMLRVTQRLRKISEGLVDFARVRRHEMEPLELRALIDEAWALVAIDEKAAEITFCNEVGADDMAVGNPDRLIQVFVNLLRNSLVALQSGGKILVRSRLETEDGRSTILISVEDDGPGIPEDVLPGIFDAFVSTRLDSRGTGLGLTVAEGIVQQHGGVIRASNRPEGGARLDVVLPAASRSVLKPAVS